MKSVLMSALMIATLGMMESANAAQRLVLEMNDQMSRGTETIGLKREIRSQYPRMQLNKMKLKSVRVVAKSKRGRGEAALLVNGYERDRSRVVGGDFHSHRPRSFDRVNLQNYGRSDGQWQVRLDGRIKLRKIVVMVERKRHRPSPRPNPISYKTIGVEKVEKFAQEHVRFSVHERGVEELVISADKQDIYIESAVVRYRNGDIETLHRFEGTLREDRIKTIYIGGRNVSSVSFYAQSRELFGSRGKLKLEVGLR